MKSIAVLLLVGSLALGSSASSEESATTQRDLTRTAVQRLTAAEKEMSEVLDRLRNRKDADSNSISALEKSQQMWAQ